MTLFVVFIEATEQLIAIFFNYLLTNQKYLKDELNRCLKSLLDNYNINKNQ